MLTPGLLLLLVAGAPPAGPQQDNTLVLTGGRYLDVRAGAYRENGGIVLRGGKIAELHQPEERWKAPAGAVVRSAEGQTILPGLIDAHVHLTLAGTAEANALATLRAGFTTVVDLGSANGGGAQLRDAIAAGSTPGPAVVAAGSWIGSRGGVCEFGGATVTTPAEAGARARLDLAAGADLLKICVTGWPADAVGFPDSVEFKLPMMDAVMAVARSAQRPVYAHAIGRAGAVLAASHGVRALAHTPIVDSAEAAQLARSGVYLISTLATLTRARGGAGEQVRASFQRLHRAGMPVVLGTDAGVLPHGRNANELNALVQSGLTPIEALRAATVTAAALLGRADLGEVKGGAAGDLVVVGGDPLNDVAALAQPVLVVKAGRVVE